MIDGNKFKKLQLTLADCKYTRIIVLEVRL